MNVKNAKKSRTSLASRSPKVRFIAAVLALCSVLCFVASGCTKEDNSEEDDEYKRGHDVYLDYEEKLDEANAYYLFEPGNTEDYALAGLTVSTDI